MARWKSSAEWQSCAEWQSGRVAELGNAGQSIREVELVRLAELG